MAISNQQNDTNTPFNDIPLLLSDAIAQAQTLFAQFAQSDGFESGLRLAFGDGILDSALAPPPLPMS